MRTRATVMRTRATTVAVAFALALAPLGSAAVEPDAAEPGGSEPGEATIEADYDRAGQAYRSGDHARAARLFQQLARRVPDDPAVHFYLADALSHERRPEEARQHFARFLKTLVDQRETPLAEYRPELKGSVGLVRRLGRVEDEAPQPVEDDIAPVFGGIAIGAGVAALGLAAAAVVSNASTRAADKAWTDAANNYVGCDGAQINCAAASESTNTARASLDESAGRTQAFTIAAAVMGGLALLSTGLWFGFRDDESSFTIAPEGRLGDAAYGGISIGGQF